VMQKQNNIFILSRICLSRKAKPCKFQTKAIKVRVRE